MDAALARAAPRRFFSNLARRATGVTSHLDDKSFLDRAYSRGDHARVRGDTSHDEVLATSGAASIRKRLVAPGIHHPLALDSSRKCLGQTLLQLGHQRALNVHVGLLARGENDGHAIARGKLSKNNHVLLEQLQWSGASPRVRADLVVDENYSGVIKIEGCHDAPLV